MQLTVGVKNKYTDAKKFGNTTGLQRILIICSLVNLLIVSLLGVFLRAYPFFDHVTLSYKNVLHGHSHFAFGGWIMPAILALLLRSFPQLETKIAYRHRRNIAFLLLFSAYGMLIAFPLQGYKLISICFSTLSIISGYYLAIVCWKAMRVLPSSVTLRFLKWGLVYSVLSSLGPLATGPLIIMGKTNSPLYFDVIYFYLHFQYNGWFVFALLALLYQYLDDKNKNHNGHRVFKLLNFGCVPTYFLSILWHQPSVLFNIIGGLAAASQLVAFWFLLKDIAACQFKKQVKHLMALVIAAFGLKIFLQLLSALPSVALLAYHYRNFVIAYLHVVLLGCISLFLITWIIQQFKIALTKQLRTGLVIFIFSFVVSEVLLVLSPISVIAGFKFSSYSLLLLLVSCLLPVSILLFGGAIIKQLHNSAVRVSKPAFNLSVSS